MSNKQNDEIMDSCLEQAEEYMYNKYGDALHDMLFIEYQDEVSKKAEELFMAKMPF